MDRSWDVVERVSRALRTPRQVRQAQRESWERRQGFLPEYHARELLEDSRGLFTPKDELSKMDGFLARHGRMETNWRSKYPRLVIDVRSARRELEAKIRAEGLDFWERARLRRNFRVTLNLLELQGARRSYLSGTLTLDWQQKSLYRFGALKRREEAGKGFEATGITQAIVDEARRQSGPRATVLRYSPRLDPRQDTYRELKRLQKESLAERDGAGSWKLDERRLRAKLHEARRKRPLLAEPTLARLRQGEFSRFSGTGWQRVTATDTATRQALGDLEFCYPRACRQAADGYEINAQQLRPALYADRMRYTEWWVTEHHQPVQVTGADYRLAHALALSTNRGETAGEKAREIAVYHPDHDPSGKAAQIERYLRGLALEGQQPAVRFGHGGSFLIDRQEAHHWLQQNRAALFDYERRLGEPTPPLPARVVTAFTHHGRAQADGGWQLDPRQAEAREQATLIWHLHRLAALKPDAIRHEPDGRYRLSPEAARHQALPGTPEWAERMTERHQGLQQRTSPMDRPERDYLLVSLNDERAPLSSTLSPMTQATYERVARRQRLIALEERPRYLVERANELERAAWWLEHAVMRRELRALELAAGPHESLRRQCQELRIGIEAMDYQALRSAPSTPSLNPARQALAPQVVRDLKDALRERGDQELLDAIIISEATGLRPGELARGVRLESSGRSVRIYIQGGKQAPGIQDTEARFSAARGADRIVEVTSKEVSELAERHQGYFRPVSSPDALRFRLREVRREIPGGENLRFYHFRHALKNHLENEGHSRADIARQMGHRSLRSQEEYGIDS